LDHFQPHRIRGLGRWLSRGGASRADRQLPGSPIVLVDVRIGAFEPSRISHNS